MQFMKTFLFFAAVLLVNNNCAFASNLRHSRNLALQLIAGFEVSSDVSDVVCKESLSNIATTTPLDTVLHDKDFSSCSILYPIE